MDILLWIVLGALVGWIASVIIRTNVRQGILMDIVLGVVGAIVGGFLMNMLGQPGVFGLNLYSLIVAFAGAVVLIWLGRLIYKIRI